MAIIGYTYIDEMMPAFRLFSATLKYLGCMAAIKFRWGHEHLKLLCRTLKAAAAALLIDACVDLLLNLLYIRRLSLPYHACCQRAQFSVLLKSSLILLMDYIEYRQLLHYYILQFIIDIFPRWCISTRPIVRFSASQSTRHCTLLLTVY